MAYEVRISDWSSDVCSSDLFRQSRLTDDGTRNVVGFDPLKNLHFGFTVGGKMGCEVSPLLFAASEPRLAHAQNRNRDGVFVSAQSAVITGVCQMNGCCQNAASSDERRVGKDCVSACRTR